MGLLHKPKAWIGNFVNYTLQNKEKTQKVLKLFGYIKNFHYLCIVKLKRKEIAYETRPRLLLAALVMSSRSE